MSNVLTVLHELWHLFVDDGAFAAAIVIWPALIWFARAQIGLSGGWAPVVLFAGLICILVASAVAGAKPAGS
jgi:hypothetical protein